MLDAHQMNVFLTAAETMSFTQAAQRLHMTQPSISQHIQVLEKHLNTPLFIREGRRLKLTDAGAALVPLAREMVTLSIRAEETMNMLKGAVHGHMIVGCSTTPGKYVLPSLLAEFMRRHPLVTAACEVTSRRVALQMLCEGAVQLALSSAREALERDLEFRRFMVETVVLIAPLGHPWSRREQIEPEELLTAPFILREEGSGTYTAARQGLAEVGLSLSQLRTMLTLGNSEAIALAVEEGVGVGFVTQTVATRLVSGRVARVAVRGLSMQQEIFLARQARRAASATADAFWNFIFDPANDLVRRLSDERWPAAA